MSTTGESADTSAEAPAAGTIDMKLEVVTLPVSDVDRAFELVVDDIDAARKDLISRGVEVSEVFHRDGGEFLPGPDPEDRPYLTFASFSDPDGNGWLLQEVKERPPGRE